MGTVKLIITIQVLCILISFIFSIPTIGNTRIPSYMKFMYMYSIVALLYTGLFLFDQFVNIIDDKFSSQLIIASIIFHFIFLSWFFYRVIVKSLLKKISIILFLILTPILFYQVTTSVTGNLNRMGYITANLGLIIFCMVYYFQMIAAKIPEGFTSAPSFWIVTGIFVSMTSVIALIIIDVFLIVNIHTNVYNTMNTVSAISYGVMHLFFAKAYSCSVENKKLSIPLNHSNS